MHIAFPFSKDTFNDSVIRNIKDWQPENTIIHSTIPIGTTRQIEKDCDYGTTLFYSPIRGRHPNLAPALRQFPKWYATSILGEYDERITAYFAAAGIQTRRAPSFEALELMKLWETTSFALQLTMWMEIENELKKLPGDRRANMNAMKSWLWEKRKCYDGDIGLVPVLDVVPGPLGGHCLSSNIGLLREQMHPALYQWLTESNEMRK